MPHVGGVSFGSALPSKHNPYYIGTIHFFKKKKKNYYQAIDYGVLGRLLRLATLDAFIAA